MAEETQQESKKTVVSFVVGLLIGGLLVWAFSGPAADAPETSTPDTAGTEETSTSDADADGEAATDDDDTEADENNEEADAPAEGGESNGSAANSGNAPVAELPTGDGSVEVSDQPAGSTVTLDRVVFPIDEGWVAVRSYTDEQLGNILGAARFSKEQGLVPEEVPLLAPTTAGNEYAIVFFTENGDREFNLANDVQVDSVFATFTAE